MHENSPEPLSVFSVVVKEDLPAHDVKAHFYRVNEDETGGLDFYVRSDCEDGEECVATYAGGKWRRVMLTRQGGL